MNFIDKKIEEMGKFVSVVSFKKGTDNYNKLKKILTETYEAGVNGDDVFDDDKTIDEIVSGESYPLNHD
jgi:hypothetical protein